MKMKKTISLALVALLAILSLSSCGNKEVKLKSDMFMAPQIESYINKLDLKYSYKLAETLAYDEKYQDNKIGWRTSGSDAEHRAADFLEAEMISIGLDQVEKSPVTVDKFQFNDSKLTIDGTKIDFMPASYQASGTGPTGISAEIVDCGTGFRADYEGKDVAGKIVLVAVNQMDESWIDGYVREASVHGAAAIITYSTGGYGEENKDTINVQDICCGDLMPTVAISFTQAETIKNAMKKGHTTANLMVDAVLEKGTGTSYNVIGKLKGKSSEQQIIVSAHYDKYWFGFQDDSTAVSLVLSMAKAMKESGYLPENDILFVCHGAEEWGVSGTQFDWTTGAWRNITEANPDWSGKTIAMFNFELPAFDTKSNELTISSVPEFSAFVESFVTTSGLVTTSGKIKSINPVTIPTDTMEDGISYRWAGVPYFLNSFQTGDFIKKKYHTSSDDKSTWHEDTMRTNLNLYGAMVIYTDQMPALTLDFTGTCKGLEDSYIKESQDIAGVDGGAYEEGLVQLKDAATAHRAKVDDINNRYQEAIKANSSQEDLAAIRAEGAALNQKTLAAFHYIQTTLISCDSWGVQFRHEGIDKNIDTLVGTIESLEKKVLYADDKESGALDRLLLLNGSLDYNYYIFTPQVATDVLHQYDPQIASKDMTFWATDRLNPPVYVGDTTYYLVVNSQEGNEANINFDEAIKVYQGALGKCYDDLKSTVDSEIQAMKVLSTML